MLCRAVTAAVAVTCTLSLAHGQATRLDRIKDLICVLLLSGIQKEDLDADVLTKLQRHNVNIDDTNNEELLKMCTNERENKNNNSDITLQTESQTRVDCANKNNNSYYFSTEHKSKHELQENDNKAFNKNRDENKVNFDKIIQDNYRQTEVESLLKYVKDLRMNESAKSPDNRKEPDNKRSITDSLHSPEEDTLNKLLVNVILRRNNATTFLTTTQKTINIDDLFEKLYSLRIPDMRKNYNSNGELGRSFIYSPMRRNVEKSQKEKEIAENSELMRENSHISRKNLTDILSLLNQDADLIRNFNERTEHRLKWARNPYLNNFERSETVDTSNTTRPNVEVRYEISRNMIKEIADSVKEIVLRDLRKELHKTTDSVDSSSSTTTTIKSTTRIEISTKKESITQTTRKEENTKTQESVMNKFLELFEEIKSLRQNTIVLTSDSEKDINSKDLRPKDLQVTTPHRITNVLQPFYGNQAYGKNQYPTTNLGYNFNFAPQLLNQKSNRTIITENPKKLNKGLPVITVQTNNIEIPPLGIPLSKPQNIISQNIIVTAFTKAPYRIVKSSSTNNNDSNGSPFKNINHNVGNQYLKSNKHLMAYKSKEANPRITKEPHTFRSHNFRTSNEDNVIRLTLNNNEQSDKNADYYEKINIGKYYPNLNSDESKPQVIPRFHEQLEKAERNLDYPEQEKFVDYAERYPDNTDQNEYVDNNDCCNKKFRYSQAMIACCDRKIASRQQMSINNVKKKSYDDTHFKKFLQSQQKVTDMLEKILGDKGNVHSVETA